MKIYYEEDGAPKELSSDDPVVQLGRGMDNQIVCSDPRASRHHCRVLHTPHGYFLEDLRSRNGTLLNGNKVDREKIEPGDVIQIGAARYWFGKPPEERSDAGAAHAPAAEAEKMPRREAAAAPSAAASVTAGDVYLEGLDGALAGKRIPITKLPYTIGRRANNEFRIDDGKASGNHARIVRRGQVFVVEDLGSRNGTFVNGQAVKEAPLTAGCRLQVGDSHFRVQVPGGDAAAVAAVPAVGADLVPEDDFARFDVQEFLRETDASKSQPFIAIGMALMAAAILYFTVDITLKRVQARRPDPATPGNLVTTNWSFEEPVAESGEVPGWSAQPAGAARLSIGFEGAQFPGLRALALDPTRAPDAAYEIVEAAGDLITFDADASYHLAGHVLQRGAYAAGLQVTWYRDSEDGAVEVGRSFTAALRQPGDEDDVTRIVTPPRSASRARVSCVAIQAGAMGGASFDRIHFGPTPPPWLDESIDAGEGEPVDHAAAAGAATAAPEGDGSGLRGGLEEVVTLRAAPGDSAAIDAGAPIEAAVGADGVVRGLRRGTTMPAVLDLAPGLPPSRDPAGFGPRLDDPVVFGRSAGLRLLAVVPDLAGADWVPVEMRYQSQGDALVFDYRFQKARVAGALPEAAALWMTPASLAPDWNAYGDDGPVASSGQAREGAANGVRELVFGRGAAQIALQFSAPVSIESLPAGAGVPQARLVAVAVAAGGSKTVDLQVRISALSRQEEVVIERLMREARALHGQNNLAEALDRLESIRKTYPWRKGAIELCGRLEADWLRRAQESVARLEEELRILKRIASPLIHDSLLARAKALQGHFKGQRENDERLRALIAEIDAFWQSRQGTGEQIRRLFRQGLADFEADRIHLAELCLRRVREAEGHDADERRRAGEVLDLIQIKKRGKALGAN